FAHSETPLLVGRVVAALAADPDAAAYAGRALTCWDLARHYGVTDVDGAQPHWDEHLDEAVEAILALTRGGARPRIERGNALVEPREIDVQEDSLSPFAWADGPFADVIAGGGFDAIVGNPPYVEPRRLRRWLAPLYEHIKTSGRYRLARAGKTDLSLPFLERAASLLAPEGRLAFLIQSRFLRAEYGREARRWLLDAGLLEAIDDFGDRQLFAGRTTYATILTLTRGATAVRYRDHSEARVVERTLDHATLDDAPWCLGDPPLAALHRSLARAHGRIGDHAEIAIRVGLQALHGKTYVLEPIAEEDGLVTGRSGLGDVVTLERGAVRPLCRNRRLYPLCRPQNAWIVFPYDDDGRPLLWPEFSRRSPAAARYLAGRRATIEAAVETPQGAGRWHLYRYPKNLDQARPRVLTPMTIEDPIATVDLAGAVFQDNVNVNALVVDGDAALLKALCVVINSSLFSALARHEAGMNASGWRKLNRQYLARVPLPLPRLRRRRRRLAALADELTGLQAAWIDGATRADTEVALARAWQQVDAAVAALYELDDAGRAALADAPRQVDRIALLRRQSQRSESARATDGSASVDASQRAAVSRSCRPR
ncbi:MAG: Eco57I restriction-modification methylase domain-containing protein, partial [Myxococcales bacterium]|nr:Eco57I restriction-modification methylase domain-containing protein [Myxococcales bacterium]